MEKVRLPRQVVPRVRRAIVRAIERHVLIGRYKGGSRRRACPASGDNFVPHKGSVRDPYCEDTVKNLVWRKDIFTHHHWLGAGYDDRAQMARCVSVVRWFHERRCQ